MANEFVTRNGFISLDSSRITGSLNVSGGITGSLFGTASFAVSASSVISASFASTASSVNPLRQNVRITGSLFVTSSTVTAALQGSGSAMFTVDGTSGRLFQIDDTLSGSLFSVNTAAGLPVMEAFSNNTVRMGQYGSNVFYISQSQVGIGKENALNGVLDVSGSAFITGSLNNVPINSYIQAASGFSKSFAIINNSNIQATDVGTFPVWRCNVPCTASMVLMYQDSGSSVDINAAKNGSNLLSSNLTNSSLNTWVSSSTLQNQNFNVGDILSFQLVSFTGTPKEVTIQTSFNY